MQQTTKYKFNLIDTSDAFGPEKLNDNAQKLENALIAHKAETDAALAERDVADEALSARIVQAREENAVLKLASGVKSGSNTTFDLSGIDITQYGALLLLFCGGSGEYLTVNGANFCQIARSAINATSNSLVWLWNNNGVIACAAYSIYYNGSSASSDMYGTRSKKWADITSLGITKGTATALYGFKA